MKTPPNQCRVTTGIWGTSPKDGSNGIFIVPINGRALTVVASDGEGWEHVSVSLPNRNPNWGEMCAIKSLFWGEEETVIQYHPPKSQYVNNHPYCLHLWKPKDKEVLLPPSNLIGIK